MRTLHRAVSAVVASVCLGTTSCGGPPSESAAAGAAPGGPAGVWEMRFRDAVGQDYLNVLELREDGSYATYMQDATPDDHGRYDVSTSDVSFVSAVDARLSQSLRYELDGDTLTIFPAPFPGTTFAPPPAQWQRSGLGPAFQAIQIADDELPAGLPGMVAAAMASQALPWHADAVPVSVEVEIRPPGRRLRVRVRFYSPSSNEGMELAIRKYVFTQTVFDGSRMAQAPLPPDFIDLPEILAKAASDGVTGKFRRADIRSYRNAGPAWMISPEGPRGATYSAVTGARIEGDVTGYIAQYEADWAKNAALWRNVFERHARCPPGEARDRLFGGGCMNATTRSLCTQWGGRWKERGYTGEGYCAQN